MKITLTQIVQLQRNRNLLIFLFNFFSGYRIRILYNRTVRLMKPIFFFKQNQSVTSNCSTYLQNASLKVFSKGKRLLVKRVQRASCGASLCLGDAALAAHQVHLHVGRRQRAAALPRLKPSRTDHLHLYQRFTKISQTIIILLVSNP